NARVFENGNRITLSTVENHNMRAMIDTGASITVVHPRALPESVLKTSKGSLQLGGAFGQTVLSKTYVVPLRLARDTEVFSDVFDWVAWLCGVTVMVGSDEVDCGLSGSDWELLNDGTVDPVTRVLRTEAFVDSASADNGTQEGEEFTQVSANNVMQASECLPN